MAAMGSSFASFASLLWLVIEAVDEKGEHYATYFIEGNKEQYYDARDPRQHEHYHVVFDWQLKDEQEQLSRRNFDAVSTDEGKIRSMWKSWHAGAGNRKKYYCVLRNNNNYYLQDVVVINVFRDDPALKPALNVITKFYFREMIELMLEDPTIATTDDKRRNMRVDIGLNPRNSTDSSKVDGMNLPKRRKLEKCKGIFGDATHEHSLFKMGRVLMQLSDIVVASNPHKDDDLAKRAFVDDSHRAIMDVLKWAEQLGLTCDTDNDRHSAMSFFLSGEVNRQLIKTEKHKDTQNCASNPRSPTFTQLVMVNHGGRLIELRGGLNTYAKGGNTAIGKKLEALVEVTNDLTQHMKKTNRLLDQHHPRQLSWEELCIIDKEQSVYIDWVLRTMRGRRREIIAAYNGGKNANWNDARKEFAMESLLSMMMTKSSSSKWVEVFERAVLKMCNNGERILDVFGRGEEEVESLANMRKIFEEANDPSSNTKSVLRSLAQTPKRGGLHNVGAAWSHRLLDAAVKLKVVHNMEHSDHCRFVAMSENLLLKRLGSKYNMQGHTHALEVIPYVRGKLSRINSNEMCARWLMEMVSPEGNKSGSESITFLYVIRKGQLLRAERSRHVAHYELVEEALD
jgi:hypothetical protein